MGPIYAPIFLPKWVRFASRSPIEASSQFRFPEIHEGVGDISTTGWALKYDGCHIFVFDDESPLNTSELFELLLQPDREPNTYVPAPKKHRVEGHDTVEYVTSRFVRERAREATETQAIAKQIDAAVSIHYWIASPSKNVLIVSTTRDFLAESLRKIEQPDQTAFPESLEEWNHLNNDVSVWGLRHFQPKPRLTDLSDNRRHHDLTIAGLTFEIDANAGKATLTFLNCNPQAKKWMRSSIESCIHAKTQFRADVDGTLVAEIDWSTEPPEVADRIKLLLCGWLQTCLGHAVVM